MKTRAFAVTISIAFAFSPTAASAAPPSVEAPPSAETRQAAAHFDRGVTYYQEGDYSAALVEFTRAYEIAPSWRVLFNIGQAHFQLHEYVEALTTLQQFAAEGGDQIKPKRRAEVDAELADLRNRVGYVTIESSLAEAAIAIDGRPVGVTPIGEPIAVSAGVRRVTARQGDRDPIERRVSVVGGETVGVRFDFAAPSPGPSEVTFVPSPEPSASGRAPNRLPPILAWGGSAAVLVTGGVFGAIALYDKSRLDTLCAARASCPTRAQPLIDAMSRDATIANIALGVAAVGAVTGLTLWFTAGSKSANGEAPASSDLWIAPGFVHGTF